MPAGSPQSDAAPHSIIRASAGAGKTYELTSRYIGLLHRGHSPSGILATTFTRKAAGEILGRLLSRLSEAARRPDAAAALADELGDPAMSAGRCRQLLADVCRSLHAVSICTIDSFFARMARCFHFELDVPLNAGMIGEGDAAAKQLRAEAIDAMLADEDLKTLLDMMQRLHHDSAKRSVASFIDDQVTELYDVYRRAPDVALWSKLEAPDRLDDAAFDTADVTLQGLLDTAEARWRNGLASAVQLAQDRDWQALLSKGLALPIVDGRGTFRGKPIPEDIVNALEPLISHAKADLLGETVRRTEATHSLLERFDLHYTKLRQLHGTLFRGRIAVATARLICACGRSCVTSWQQSHERSDSRRDYRHPSACGQGGHQAFTYRLQ